MKKSHQQFALFSSRFTYFAGEKPPVISESDQKKAEDAAKEALARARSKAKAGAIEQGKTAAVSQPVDKPAEQKQLPEIPAKLAGFKFDSKDSKVNPAQGTIEQPFQFGDYNIKGKVILPNKPTPGAKTTYLFNYVDNPDKFDHGHFFEELKKKQADLGNTVVITLKTPEGETKIGGEKVPTMTKLMGDLERFQADLSKDPKYAGINLARAENVLHMTSVEEAPKVQALLNKYTEASSQKDPRITKIGTIINNDPTVFAQSLEKALTPLSSPSVSPPPIDSGAGSPRRVARGGGGVGGGGVGGGGGHGGGATGSVSSTSDIPGQQTDAQSSGSTGPEFPRTSERTEQYAEKPKKMLTLGDSLMTGAESVLGREFSTEEHKLDKRAMGGWATIQILQLLRTMEREGKLKDFRNEAIVVNGGVNDIANGRSARHIVDNLKEIFKIAAAHNIRVYACTMAPFKGAAGWKDSLKIDYEKKEQVRKDANAELESLAGQPGGPYKVVALHKKFSEGGLADDSDPSALHAAFAGADKLHLTGKGYQAMGKAILNVVGTAVRPSPGALDTARDPGRIPGFEVTPADRQAADAYLAEVKSRPNPESSIGETKLLPGGDKLLKVAWHQNHSGQWGTSSYRALPGRHIGVQVEPAPEAQKKSPSA